MSIQSVQDDLRSRPGTGDIIAVIDPVTEEQIAEFTDGGAKAVDEAVTQARETFDSGVWANKPGSDRARVLWRISELIDTNADELAQLDSVNTGMPLNQARRNMDAASEF